MGNKYKIFLAVMVVAAIGLVIQGLMLPHAPTRSTPSDSKHSESVNSASEPAQSAAPSPPDAAANMAQRPVIDPLRYAPVLLEQEGAQNDTGGTILHRVDTPQDWEKIAARPASHIAARAEIVKFVIDRGDQDKLYLVDTARWPIHYFFVRDHIQADYAHAAFNKREYSADDRRFVMGSVVHYTDAGLWTLETIPSDAMPAEMLEKAFTIVKEAGFYGDELLFRPQSAVHEERAAALAGKIPVLAQDAFMAAQTYQPLTLGVSFGRLRIVRDVVDPASVKPDEILVTATVPDDLPVCAGLVTARLQAPLAHVSLLLGNRGTPNMALRGAVDEDAIKALDGQWVRLEVGAQDYTLSAATAEDVALWRQSARPSTIVMPALEAKVEGLADLPDLCDLGIKHTPHVGGKAAYLGAMCAIRPRLEMPGGFVVPVSAYLDHVNQGAIAPRISALIQAIEQNDMQVEGLEQSLAALRTAIMEAPVSPALLAALTAKMSPYEGRKVILRSSANVEDIQGFSGAGLYSSKVVKPIAGLQSEAYQAALADALRHVWASVWSMRAVQERTWYRIDHRPVAMAVIIQPFVEGLSANGVAITANPFTRLRPAYFVNAQTMEGSITGAKDGETPESMLIYTYADQPEIHILTRSTLSGGKPVLSEATTEKLAAALKVIHARFVTKDDANNGKAMDVEFLIKQDGDVVIVQARPYSVDFREK